MLSRAVRPTDLDNPRDCELAARRSALWLHEKFAVSLDETTVSRQLKPLGETRDATIGTERPADEIGLHLSPQMGAWVMIDARSYKIDHPLLDQFEQGEISEKAVSDIRPFY